MSAAELEAVKAKEKKKFLAAIDSNMGLAMQLAYAQNLQGDWREAFRWLAKIDKVTAADIQRVAQRYVRQVQPHRRHDRDDRREAGRAGGEVSRGKETAMKTQRLALPLVALLASLAPAAALVSQQRAKRREAARHRHHQVPQAARHQDAARWSARRCRTA